MRPSNVRRIAMAAAFASAMASGSCVAPRSRPSTIGPDDPRGRRPPTPGDPQGVGQVIEAHNLLRSRAGLAPLILNAGLEAAATGHALDMAGRGKMTHRGGDGSDPFRRMGRQGYRFRAAAENVASGFDDVQGVMAGWMGSPGHRRNILGNFSEIGVGRATAKDGASYWCVTFGTPEGG